MKGLYIKSVSVMKKTRESSNNQITLAEKQNLVACLASMGVTHVEITMFTADNADLVAHGFIPSPKTIEAETKEWYDVIHAQPNVYGASVFGGYLKVFDRPVFPQTGDNQGSIVGFPIETTTPVGTAAGLTVTPVYDDFNRTSVGGSYTTAADNGSAGGNVWNLNSGQLQGPAADGWKRTCLTTATYGDFTAVAKIKKVGHQQLIGRATTNASTPGYGFQLRDTTFRLERPGLENITEVPFTYTEGNWYWVKMNCTGNVISGKVWAADDVNFPNSTAGSENEPTAWNIQVTRTDFSSGLIGFSGETSSGLFDNLTITPAAPNLNSTWVGRYYNYLYNHVGIDHIQTGDIQCPFAEISATAFSGHFWTTQAGAVQAVIECHKVANTFATAAGNKTIIFLNNPNFSEVSSGWWGPQAAGNPYSDTGYVCADYYGNARGNNSVLGSDYVFDWGQMFAGTSLAGYGIGTGNYPEVWGEWGDLSGSIFLGQGARRTGDNYVTGTTTVEQWMNYWVAFLKAIRDGLVNTNPQKLKGFNYWGGWEGQNTSLVYKTGSGASSQYFLNWRGQMLRNFFINDGMGRTPVIQNGAFTEASPSFGGRQMTF